MADLTISTHSARSRAPIDAIGIKWWDSYGEQNDEHKNNNDALIKINSEDKATSTDTLYLQRELVNEILINKTKHDEPKDKVFKKWKEEQAKKRYEQAKNAVIKSLKDKFMDTSDRNTNLNINNNKSDVAKTESTPAITGDNVKVTSNLNGSHEGIGQAIIAPISCNSEVKINSKVTEDVSHARKLQMGPGGELAQWRLAPRGSRAAGAEGGLRGLIRDEMPTDYEKGMSTIRREWRHKSNIYNRLWPPR